MESKPEIGAEIRVLRRYNTGNYTHIEIEYKISGPFDVLRDNPNLANQLITATTNMGKTMDQVLVALLDNYNRTISNSSYQQNNIPQI
jgi:hypothetical protein